MHLCDTHFNRITATYRFILVLKHQLVKRLTSNILLQESRNHIQTKTLPFQATKKRQNSQHRQTATTYCMGDILHVKWAQNPMTCFRDRRKRSRRSRELLHAHLAGGTFELRFKASHFTMILCKCEWIQLFRALLLSFYQKFYFYFIVRFLAHICVRSCSSMCILMTTVIPKNGLENTPTIQKHST